MHFADVVGDRAGQHLFELLVPSWSGKGSAHRSGRDRRGDPSHEMNGNTWQRELIAANCGLRLHSFRQRLSEIPKRMRVTGPASDYELAFSQQFVRPVPLSDIEKGVHADNKEEAVLEAEGLLEPEDGIERVA